MTPTTPSTTPARSAFIEIFGLPLRTEAARHGPGPPLRRRLDVDRALLADLPTKVYDAPASAAK